MGLLVGSPEWLADPAKRARAEKRRRDAAVFYAAIAVEEAGVIELLEALERLLVWALEAQTEITPGWSGRYFKDSDFGVAAHAIAKARGEA